MRADFASYVISVYVYEQKEQNEETVFLVGVLEQQYSIGK